MDFPWTTSTKFWGAGAFNKFSQRVLPLWPPPGATHLTAKSSPGNPNRASASMSTTRYLRFCSMYLGSKWIRASKWTWFFFKQVMAWFQPVHFPGFFSPLIYCFRGGLDIPKHQEIHHPWSLSYPLFVALCTCNLLSQRDHFANWNG